MSDQHRLASVDHVDGAPSPSAPHPGTPPPSGISESSINGWQLAVGAPAAGATVRFEGVVRDHDSGHGVTQIDYSHHPSADAIIKQIVSDAQRLPGVLGAAAVHRVGVLRVGDTAFLAAVSAPHRREAFEACMWLVDEVKRRLPVWKNQHFTDGSTRWSNSP